MDTLTERCVERYRDLKNLKLVGAEIGIPWQTVYVRLKGAGEPVTGDKARYGSETDKLAARAERWFQAMVPHAVDQNNLGFQAKCDFIVGDAKVDVKVSRGRTSKTGVRQWIFSVKKQEMLADWFVCIALCPKADDLAVFAVLLIPGELARHHTSINLSHKGTFRGKWAQYFAAPDALREVFAVERAA